MMNRERIERLREVLKSSELDALIIAPSEELLFYTGHSPMLCERFQGLFLTRSGEDFYYCNLLYRDELEEAYPGLPVYSWFDGDGFIGGLKALLTEKGLLGSVIGVSNAVPGWQVLRIESAMELRFRDATELFQKARLIKSPEELEALRISARIADEGFADTLPMIRPGMTETELSALLAENMKKHGGTDCGAMVASGGNAGYPHYTGGPVVLEKGVMVLMDFGCVYKGLHSDMSRTVFLGEPDARWREIYHIVDEAQRAGQEAAKAGVRASAVDAAARNVIIKAGYGDRFPYRLGHGIGYSVHEEPCLHGNNPTVLGPGMAFSVEPGIYFPGEGGIRIENIVIINEKGVTEPVNHADRSLIVL